MDFNSFLLKVEDAILTPALTLIAFAAFMLFVWGVVQFIRNAESPEKRKTGQQHIVWGIIGLAIIFGAQAIISLLTNIATGV